MPRGFLIAGLGLAAMATAQTPINMPPFVSTYVAAATRGFYFFCPTNCVITGLQAPNEASQPNQVVEVLDLGSFSPPLFPAAVTPTAQLFYSNSVAAGTKVNTSIALQAGRYYGIFGCCTDAPGSATTYSSYGNGAFTTDILGIAVILQRLLTQSGIASNGGNQPCSASTGPIGRVLVDIQPAAGLYAGFTADVTTGAAPLAVNFTDSSQTNDPAGIASWAWDFDNDGTVDSTAQNPTHVFTTCGDFSVSLTVTDTINSPVTELMPTLVTTDPLTASFTSSLLAAPNTWQLTDTSTPVPTTWAWDFDNDGTVDSTAQNPIYQAPMSCTEATTRLSVTHACRNATTLRQMFLASASTIGATAGGNGLTGAHAVGNYFDIAVTVTGGIRVCGLATAPMAIAGQFDANVYLTEGSFAGKEGIASAWRRVAKGGGNSTGGGFSPPTLVDIALDTAFQLPVGNYGVAVFLSGPVGMGIAYTDGPAGPFVSSDLTIHPNGAGSSSDSELGPAVFSPRLWNGGFHYSRCSVAGEAGTGFFGTGCPGPLGTPELDTVGTLPRLGTTYRLDVNHVPEGVAVLILGISHTYSPLFGPLPLDGAVYGAPGCFLRVDSLSTIVLPTANTVATWTSAIPNDPSMVCLTLYTQAAVLATGANALNLVVSDAWVGVVGN
ncbi:MAG: PKD domain-containing protein [Planctomycetes bacterium]|nr:PKD domain-containing protein [Planctomycetota bacterium]